MTGAVTGGTAVSTSIAPDYYVRAWAGPCRPAPSAGGAADDPQIGLPRTDLVRVAARHDARNLHQVIEIVSHPRRQQLAQRDAAERGVPAAAIEIRPGQSQRREIPQIGRAQLREFIEQVVEAASSRVAELRKAIELVELAALAAFEDHAGAGQPVGPLAVNEVADDVKRAPGGFAFGGGCPRRRQAAQQRIERSRRPLQNLHCLLDDEGAPRRIRMCGHHFLISHWRGGVTIEASTADMATATAARTHRRLIMACNRYDARPAAPIVTPPTGSQPRAPFSFTSRVSSSAA